MIKPNTGRKGQPDRVVGVDRQSVDQARGEPRAGCPECGDEYWHLGVGDPCPTCQEPLVAIREPDRVVGSKTGWRLIDENTPRDGTCVLLAVSYDETPFVGYWGRVGRYTDSINGWIGHESGYMKDKDIFLWLPMPYPDPPEAP